MATRDRTTRGGREVMQPRGARYDDNLDVMRPPPDEAPLYDMPAPTRATTLDGARASSGLNVVAGIWLIISPFVLNYAGADAIWNPIVFGAIVAVAAAIRFAVPARTEWLALLNMAIGVWLFISAFWLAHSSTASWNVGVLGVVVFVLGALSASASTYRR